MLGDERLNFRGESHGTQLGAAYAELYPQHIRAMTLDGNVDHSQSRTTNLVTESTTYETELGRFAEWCSRVPTCELHGQDVGQLLDDLVKTADAQPIPCTCMRHLRIVPLKCDRRRASLQYMRKSCMEGCQPEVS